jgi:mRNA interferase YafQ
MLTIHYKNIFEKDVKKSKKRGLNMEKLKEAITLLASESPLPARYRDHTLIGNYQGHRECHIEPDWLLIYKKFDQNIVFERTGTHADLFKM